MTTFSGTAQTFSVSVTSTASTGKALGSAPSQSATVRLVNEGANRCYVAFGGSGITATVPDGTTPVGTCTPVLSGEDVILSVGSSQTHISAVTRATETATLIVSVGEGT